MGGPFLIISGFVMLMASVAASTEDNYGKKFHERDLYGIWQYESAYQQRPDGTVFYQFGERPQGYFVIAKGYYSHIVMADDLPHVASGNLKEMTPAEAEAIAENTLAHYGTMTVDERAGTFTLKIIKSSFPNFDGVSQPRTVIKLTRTELEYSNPVSSAGPGNVVYAKLRRVR
jgi:hypothetical protein